MISRETALSQIKRLSRLVNPPDPNSMCDRIVIDEIIAALMKTADNDLHASEIITEILDKSKFFPVPSDICGQRREKPWEPKLTYRCNACLDTGWRSEDDGGQGSAVRCSCRPLPAREGFRPSSGMTQANSIKVIR